MAGSSAIEILLGALEMRPTLKRRLTAITMCGLLFVGAPIAHAGIPDSVFYINPDGDNIVFVIHDVSRREVLARLIKNKGIALEWIDSSLADQLVSGIFKGDLNAVLRKLLADTNSILVYDQGGKTPSLSKILIVGKSTDEKSHTTPAADPVPGPPTSTEGSLIPPPSVSNIGPRPSSSAAVPPPPTGRSAASPPTIPIARDMPPDLLPPIVRGSQRGH